MFKRVGGSILTVSSFSDFKDELEKRNENGSHEPFSYDFWQYTFEHPHLANDYLLKNPNGTNKYVRNILFSKPSHLGIYSAENGEVDLFKYIVNREYPINIKKCLEVSKDEEITSYLKKIE